MYNLVELFTWVLPFMLHNTEYLSWRYSTILLQTVSNTALQWTYNKQIFDKTMLWRVQCIVLK